MAISMRLVAVFLLASTALVVPGEAAKKKPPPPKPSSGPFSFVNCPSSPLQYCDFYWAGYKNTVPTFTIKKFSVDTFVYDGVLYSGKTFQPVQTASTYGQCYFVPEYKPSAPKCGTSFYFKGKFSPLISNRLGARTVVAAKYKDFSNACVVLPIATAQIITEKAVGKKKAKFMYINPNDGNKQYAQGRRCVVFKTRTG